MATLRMDHVVIVVEDLESAIAFFAELGLERVGETDVSGDWVDRVNGIANVNARIVMMRTPDGSGQVELTEYRTPALIPARPQPAPPNVLGYRSVMFEVDDVDAMVARLRERGGELMGEIVEYETFYRLCYLRGPAGIIVALAESLQN